jgi:tetratricopeptide (TPR) repeat protein
MSRAFFWPQYVMDRIATFKTFIERTPRDPFPRYGLAMEHKTRGELDQAWAAFQILLEQFSDYVPTYLMAGGTLAALGRQAEAIDVYRRGVAVAAQRGDQHARRELEAALAELESANQLRSQ